MVVEVVKAALRPLRGEVLGALLWGSHAVGGGTPRSDVDICLVAGPGRDPASVLSLAWRRVDPRGLDLDVRVFEELPRYLQGAVLAHGQVVLADDEPALFEYLYPFRRRWQDEAARQRLTEDEIRALLRGKA